MYRAVSFICHRCYTDHIIDIHQAIFCFVFLSASTPFSPPDPHSLHPIFCMRDEVCDSLQTRLFLRRPQHHLSQHNDRGHPRQPAHRWWHRHHWCSGKTVIDVMCKDSELKLSSSSYSVNVLVFA